MAETTRWLPWSEATKLDAQLEVLAERFASREDFLAWRQGLTAAWLAKELACWAVLDAETLLAAWLVSGDGRAWSIALALGAWTPARAMAAFAGLQSACELVIWDEAAAPGLVEALAPLGARPFHRQVFVEATAKTQRVRQAPPLLDEDGLSIKPWTGHPRAGEALALFAGVNARTLEGVFLTLPRFPDQAACLASVEAVHAGALGEFLPWTSFIAELDGEVVGALIAVTGDRPDQVFLFDLAVTPAARGRQLARRMVDALRFALTARGWAETRFMTTGENHAVHRLFERAELIEAEENRGGYWLKA